MSIYGYTRVSSISQCSFGQRKRIEDAGFAIPEENWYDDTNVSGSIEAVKRPNFKKLLNKVVEGDTIVVTEISRVGRSTSDVLSVIEVLQKRGVSFRIMNLDGISITSPTGRLMLTLMVSCAAFEKELLIERTVHGLKAAKDSGKVLGAKFKLPPESLQQAHKWMAEKVKHEDIAHRLNIGVATLYNLKRDFMGSVEKMQEYKQRYEAQQLQLKGVSA